VRDINEGIKEDRGEDWNNKLCWYEVMRANNNLLIWKKRREEFRVRGITEDEDEEQ
jgi:hypothetical protein